MPEKDFIYLSAIVVFVTNNDPACSAGPAFFVFPLTFRWHFQGSGIPGFQAFFGFCGFSVIG